MPVFRCRAERPGGVQKLSDQSGGTKPLSAIYESGLKHASCRLESAVWRYLLLLRLKFTPTPKTTIIMMDNTRKRKIVRNFVIGYLLLQVLVIVLYLGFGRYIRVALL